MTLLGTAASESLVAVLHTASFGHSRLSIPLYACSNGELQSTLTCSLTQDDNDDSDAISKLKFAASEYVCVCTSPDTVVVWNVARGVVVHTLKLDTRVYDIVSHNSSLYLLTHKKKKLYIYEYSVESGSLVRKLKCGMHVNDKTSDKTTYTLAVSNEYVAIRNEEQVRVLSLEHATKVAKFKVPNNNDMNNNSSMSLQDGRLALVTSTEILLYNLAESHDKPVGRILVQSSSPVLSVDMKDNLVLVHTEANVLLYKWPSTVQEKDPLTPITTIVSDNTVESVRIAFGASDLLVAVLHSTAKGVNVQRVTFRNDNEDTFLEKVVVGFPSSQEEGMEHANTTSTATKRSKPSTTTTLGPGQAGGEALQASDRPVKKAKTTTAEKEDLSIAERLEQLAQEMNQDEADDEEEESPKQTTSKKATTESLSNLLNQALTSGDDSMLELSLSIRDKKVIATSLQDLSEDLVSLLLTKLTFRLSHKPNRAAELSVWISLVLQSGKVRSAQQLGPLRNLLQERVNSFPHLMQLEGRLSVLAAMK